MKKSIIYLLLLCTILFIGCSAVRPDVEQPSSPSTEPAFSSPVPATEPQSSTQPQTEPETSPSLESPATSEAVDQADPFSAFSAKLDNAGYSYEAITMAAEYVHAQRGMKYVFDFGSVELYQFDPDSPDLVSVTESGSLTLEGFGSFPCELNGCLALFTDLSQNEDVILSMFGDL